MPVEKICPQCKTGDNTVSISQLYRLSQYSEEIKSFFGDYTDHYYKKYLVEVGEFLSGYQLHEERECTLKNEELLPPPQPQEKLHTAKVIGLGYTATLLICISLALLVLNEFFYFSVLFALSISLLLISFYLLRKNLKRIHEINDKYKNEYDTWNKKMFCRNCGTVFIPEG